MGRHFRGFLFQLPTPERGRDHSIGVVESNLLLYVHTYLCMYMCMHILMHVCIYVCTYVCMYVYMYVHT